MVGSVKVFGEVVGQVFLSWVPRNIEVANVNLICDPEEAHFHGPGALAFYCVVGNGNSGVVVTVDGGGWLWMT